MDYRYEWTVWPTSHAVDQLAYPEGVSAAEILDDLIDGEE